MCSCFLLFPEEHLHPGPCSNGLGTSVYVGAARYGVFYRNPKDKWINGAHSVRLKGYQDAAPLPKGLD